LHLMAQFLCHTWHQQQLQEMASLGSGFLAHESAHSAQGKNLWRIFLEVNIVIIALPYFNTKPVSIWDLAVQYCNGQFAIMTTCKTTLIMSLWITHCWTLISTCPGQKHASNLTIPICT
jgi:hypothetical protein